MSTGQRASTTDKERRCAAGPLPGRGYCGRKAKTPEPIWKTVTCSDCAAARRADEAAGDTRWKNS